MELNKNKSRIKTRPWFNKQTWKDIYAKLYSDNFNDKLSAVKRIRAWKIKNPDQLPPAEDCTASLVFATLQEEDAFKQFAVESIMSFVNCISAIAQTHQHAIPVKSVLSKHGLPEWLGELRNKIAHFPLDVPLDLLHNGVELALKWLKQNYWEKKLNNIDNFKGESNKYKELITNQLTKYQEYSIQNMKVVKENHKMTIPGFKLCTATLKNFSLNQRNLFFKILCGPKHLLSMKLHAKELEETDESEYLNDNSLELPEYIQNLWKPLLLSLNRHKLIQVVLENLLLQQTKISLFSDKLIISWAIFLLAPNKRQMASSLRKQICSTWQWQPILRTSVTNPCPYILKILPKIIEKVEISHADKDKICALTTLYLGQLANTNEPSNSQETEESKTTSIDDLQMIQHNNHLAKYPDSHPFSWKHNFNDECFKGHPLGTVIYTSEPAEEAENIDKKDINEDMEVENDDMRGLNNEEMIQPSFYFKSFYSGLSLKKQIFF